jgi:hypothetical protein
MGFRIRRSVSGSAGVQKINKAFARNFNQISIDKEPSGTYDIKGR